MGAGRVVRSATAVAGSVFLVGMASGCAKEGSGDIVTAAPAGYAASQQFLSETVDRSTGQPYQYEIGMAIEADIEGDSFDVDAQLASGVQDGDTFSMHFDLTMLMEQMSDDVGGGEKFPIDDFTMDFAGTPEVVYIRAPFLAELIEVAGSEGVDSMPSELEDLADLGDGWGRVDLAAIGAEGDLADLQQALSQGQSFGQMYDPAQILEVVSTSDDIEELGSDAIDGEQVNGLAANVTMGELLEAQGVDVEEYAGGLLGESGMDQETSQRILALEMPIEVWVDADGLVRRAAFSFGQELMTTVAEAEGDDVPSDGEFNMTMTFDFSGYGEPADIELPDDDETVDITEAFKELLAQS